MSNKTIEINPNLFMISSKNKKSREKKEKPVVIKPLISPSVLKNKMLNRIKEHKTKELQRLNSQSSVPSAPNLVDYSDEFHESMNYLQSLSKKKNDDLKKSALLHNHTLKNRFKPNTTSQIELDLPDSLREETTFQYQQPINTEPLHLTKKEPPYGVLKGGNKPTYRDWNKTQKNQYATNSENALLIDENNKELTNREKRLNYLKQKIKENKHLKQTKEDNEINERLMTENLIQKDGIVMPENNLQEQEQEQQQKPQNVTIAEELNTVSSVPTIQTKMSPFKRITKKTIKKKYTLGKSQIKRQVGVLLKDHKTRKKILSAQKDLRTKPIVEIKQKLREANLLRVGSNAPNDVIKKIYESAMLSGEIINENPDVLLHNLSKE